MLLDRRSLLSRTFLARMPSTTIATKLASSTFPFDPLVDVASITSVASFAMALPISTSPC